MNNLYRSDVKEYGFSQSLKEHVLSEAQFTELETIITDELKKRTRSSYDNSSDFMITKDLVLAVRGRLNVVQEINSIIYGDEEMRQRSIKQI